MKKISDILHGSDPVIICMEVAKTGIVAEGSKVCKCDGCESAIYVTDASIKGTGSNNAKTICMSCFASVAHMLKPEDELRGPTEQQLDEIANATGLSKDVARQATSVAYGRIKDFVNEAKRDRNAN